MSSRLVNIAAKEWLSVKKTYARKNFVNYDLAEKIVDRLGYADYYSKDVTIIDAYPGLGVWSAALHNAIKPSKHILLEPHINYKDFLQSKESPANSWRVRQEDPFRWKTFTQLVEEKVLEPRKLPRTSIHSEILFTANLSMIQGEQLCVQYLNCVTNQSWLQSYGRVRMLLWIRPSTAEKLLAPVGSKARHRVSVQCEASADTRYLIGQDDRAMFQAAEKEDYYPPKSQSPVLIEMNPLEHQVNQIDSFEYVIKMLFVQRTTSLDQCIGTLGPGAREDLGPHLEDILHVKPQNMTLDQIQRIVHVFDVWPFKPDILHDFYEDGSLGIGGINEH